MRAIAKADDQVTAAARIRDYYRDRDRADRTPRGILYLHLGMLSGIIDTWRTRLRDASSAGTTQGTTQTGVNMDDND
jgi:hypothetical protein